MKKTVSFGCPWGKAPCGRRELVNEIGCEGCPAFNEREYAEIMSSTAEQEAQWNEWKEEHQRELLDENYFGPWENQW